MDRLRVLASHFQAASDKEGEPSLEKNDVLAEAYVGFPQAQTMASFPRAAFDVFDLDEMLTPEERALRHSVRAFAEKEIAPIIVPYWERAEFPFELVPKIAPLNIASSTVRGNGCPGHSVVGAALVVAELARVDASCATFVMVHSSLAMLTISLLGSEEQKERYLPKMASLQWVGAWALTEPSNGSDASSLQTTARKVPGGWILNGQKRWIGNAVWCEVVVIWARNLDTKEINAFIVHKGTPGFRTAKIENKIALRCVQNADIFLTDCFVPDSARLANCNSFKDTNKVLAVSRVMVAWQPVGISWGVYDMCVRYLSERDQFGSSLSSFQAVQEKLVRMLGNIQAMTLLAMRLSRRLEEGKMTHEDASLVKAWITLRGREVVALGRELLGGNGILADFLVAKAFGDMEAIYTYEGTYEVNSLVAGRGITGRAAFKAPVRRR